jgi:imidazolonepropionase-like amidohydrolase
MELLVRDGLTPTLAVAAATSVLARAFRRSDRGRISPGMPADLLPVQHDPTTRILDTRNIVAVSKCGVRIQR